MSHTTEIIDVKHIADEILAVCVRCCNDTKTDSWHSMHASVYTDEAKLAESLTAAHKRVAGTHEAHIAAQDKLEALKGQKVQHDNGNG